MARAWQLVIKASANDKEAKRALRGLGREANDLQRKMGRAFGAIAKTGALALGAGLAGTVAVGVKELGEMQKASAQTAAVLKSTGGAAGVTQRGVENLAGAISRKTGLDDQAIQSGQNLLLTFTNIKNEAGKGNDVFDQSTQIMTDMAVAMGQDPQKAAIGLGKALNDPVKGVTALSKVGVSFTDGQKKTIKSLVDSGKSMQAQKVILGELNKEFGGSAAAYGTTLPGMVGKIKESFSGAAATIVSAFLPAITAGATKLSNLVARVQAWASSDKGQASLASLRENLSTVASAIGRVIGFMARHKTVVLGLAAAVLTGVAAYRAFMVVNAVVNAVKVAIIVFKAWRAGTLAQTTAQLALNGALLLNPIGLVVAGLVALGVGLVVAYKKCEGFRKVVNATWSWIKSNWPKLLVILTGPIGLAVVAIVKNWDTIKSSTAALYKTVVAKLGAIVGFVRGMGGKIGGAAKGMFNSVKEAFRDAINWIIGKWNGLSFGIDAVKVKGKTVVPGVKVNTPDVGYLAKGGRVTKPSIIGEDGDEQIVPLSSKYRKEGIQNLLEAAAAMGVPMYAKGNAKKAAPKKAAAKPTAPKAAPKPTTADKIAAGQSQFAAMRDARDRAFAPLDLELANAEATEDPNDDVGVIRKMIAWANTTKALTASFKLKKPGIASAALGDTRTRTTTEMTRQVNQYNEQIKQLLAPPPADDAASGDATPDTGVGADPTTDIGPIVDDGTTPSTDNTAGALTGVDIKAVFGDSVGAGRAYVNASQAAAGQTVNVTQNFTSEPNMAAAAQSAAWSFTTVMAGAPGAAA